MSAEKTKSSSEGDAEIPWYRTAFEAGYLDLYAHRNRRDAARAADFISRRLETGPDRSLLDLCCGPGRHLAALAPLFGRAAGLDLSRVLLDRARELNQRDADDASRVRWDLVEGDMRRLPFRTGAFDVVVNLFTSMGYFDEELQNAGVVGEIARVLAPGGRAVIDHMNRARLVATLDPRSERELDSGVRIVEERTFDAGRSRVIKRVKWIDPESGAREWTESVRVYRPDELESLCAAAGMQVEGIHGDFDGQAFGSDSPRMILVAGRAS